MEFTMAELNELYYLVDNGLKIVPTNSDRFILRKRISDKLKDKMRQLGTELGKSKSHA